MMKDHRIRFYERQVEQTVAGLRTLADRIEREGVPSDTASFTGTPRYLNAAERLNHELVWGITNLGAHRIFDAAYHADAAEAEGSDEAVSA